jgi:hypothetical protein
VRGRGMCPSGKPVPHRLPHSHNRRPGRSRRGKHRPSIAGAPAAHRGSTPRYRAGQGSLPGASTGVEAPRYPPSGAAGPVAGGNRRRRHARSHSVECKTVTSPAADSLCILAHATPDHLEVMCQQPGHNHPTHRPHHRRARPHCTTGPGATPHHRHPHRTHSAPGRPSPTPDRDPARRTTSHPPTPHN